MGKTAIIIPARYSSTRLPGKPLIKVKGKPIIWWVYERANQSKLADKVIVATDDERIFNSIDGFGGNVCMTSPDHQSGSDRIAEVVRKDEDIDIAVNVQGDEPMLNPDSIDKAIKCLLEDEKADIATLIRKIHDKEEVQNPNLVKAVIANDGRALYFSRSPIPYPRKEEFAVYYGHVGLYAFRREALLKMTELPQTNLEKTECLEQLRALQNGLVIKTAEIDYAPTGIDTPEDLERFRACVE
jgi:3-deoxy-manno-octulosonate cytidylyltransferase (CMP-KDO synthetase)